MKMKNAMGCLLALGLLAAPSEAEACSPICGSIFPAGTDAAPAHLPANGVFVDSFSGTSSSEITVVRLRGGETETRSLGTGSRVQITDVVAGDRLTVSASACGLMTVIDVTPEAPVPTALGVLYIEASRPVPVAVWDNRGGCTSDLGSTAAPFTLTLDPSAEPWADALIQAPVVDGTPWYETRDASVAERFVFTACEEPLPSQNGLQGVGEGDHRLRIDASVRGMDVMVSSNEEAFSLTCMGASSSCSAAMPRRLEGGLFAMAFAALAMVAVRARSTRRR